MSRCRLIAKLRGQAWFRDLTGWLDSEGIGWRVQPPTRTGHPMILLTIPGVEGEHPCTIPCTPRTGGPVADIALLRARQVIAKARAGHAPDPAPEVTSAWTPERIACLVRGINPLAEPIGP